MMSLENQVCSLDLARRLKELGVKQESLFYWYSTFKRPDECQYHIEYQGEDGRGGEMICATFTVAELGEMIVDSGKNGYLNEIYKTDDWNFKDEKNRKYISADTEADARAKMLIYLVENKFVTL